MAISDPQHTGLRASISVVACALIVVVIRWVLTADRRIFHVAPDEPSQLAVARWLSGGTRWNMFDHATWQPGLAVFIAPLYRLTDDGETVVRGALALNVAFGGVAAALLAMLVRRLTAQSWTVSAVVAVIVAVAPASISASSYVWAEPLVTVGSLAVTLLLLRFHDRDDTAAAAVAILVAVFAYSCHSRLLPLVGSAVLVTVGWQAWRRRWRSASILGAWSVALFALSATWKDWILRNVWDDPSNQNTVGAVLRRVQQPLDLAEALLGQVWYQSAATFGTAVIGAVWVGHSIRRPRPDATDTTTTEMEAEMATPAPADPESDPSAASVSPVTTGPTARTVSDIGPESVRSIEPASPIEPAPPIERVPSMPPINHVAARIVAITTLPLVGLSAVFMSGRERSDQFIYGRYNDAIMWPVVALGLVWIVGRIRNGVTRRDLALVTAVLAGTVAAGLMIDRWHGDAIREDFGVRAMIAGLLPYAEGTESLDVVRATLMSAALLISIIAVAAVAARTQVGRVPALSIALALGTAAFAIALHRTDTVLDARLNGWTASAAVAEVDDLVPAGLPLAVKTVATADEPSASFTTQRQRYQVYQFYLPDRAFVRDRGVDDDVGPYVFAPLRDPDLVDAGAELIWTDPSTKIGLWREPSA